MDQVFGLISFYINCPKAFRGFALLCKKAALCCHSLQDLKKNQFSKIKHEYGDIKSSFYPYIVYSALPNGYKHGREVKFYRKEHCELFIEKNYEYLDPRSSYIVRYYVDNKLEGESKKYMCGDLRQIMYYKKGISYGQKITYSTICGVNWKKVLTYRNGKPSILLRIYGNEILKKEVITINKRNILLARYNKDKKIYRMDIYDYYDNYTKVEVTKRYFD